MEPFGRFSLGSDYARIARESLKVIVDLEKKLDELYLRTATTEDEADLLTYEKMQLETPANRHALITIVFSALAVEAYIYDYGARNISDSFMQKYIDKLDVVGKWVVVPQLITGKHFPRNGRAFELLRKLIKARNHLVHYKSREIASVFSSMEEATMAADKDRKALIDEAKDAVAALDELAETIKALDPGEMPRVGLGTPNNEPFWIE